jgi:hypothetical protein
MKITELKATSLGARIQISSLASINRSESSTKRRAVKLVQTLSLRQGDGGREARGPSALLRVVAQGCAGQRRRRRARTGVHRHQPDAGQLHGRRGRGRRRCSCAEGCRPPTRPRSPRAARGTSRCSTSCTAPSTRWQCSGSRTTLWTCATSRALPSTATARSGPAAPERPGSRRCGR